MTKRTLAHRRMSRKSKFLLVFMSPSSFSCFNASFLFLTTSALKQWDRLSYKLVPACSVKCHSVHYAKRFICQWSVFTCMTVRDFTCFSVSETVWAEVENPVIVVRKGPEPQVDEITDLIHWLDISICSTAKKTEVHIKCYVSISHDSERRSCMD